MNIIMLGVTLLLGAALGAITMATTAHAIETWWMRRQDQRRVAEGRWRAEEQAIIGKAIVRMR